MYICFKDKKIKIETKYDETNRFYTFLAKSNDNNIMSTLTFKKSGKDIWIYKIFVNDKYSHNGASTALIYALEDFAFKNNVNFIEGKFYPENQYAKPFYEKLGYTIYKDGYETFVGKYIRKENENIKIIDNEETFNR